MLTGRSSAAQLTLAPALRGPPPGVGDSVAWQVQGRRGQVCQSPRVFFGPREGFSEKLYQDSVWLPVNILTYTDDNTQAFGRHYS